MLENYPLDRSSGNADSKFPNLDGSNLTPCMHLDPLQITAHISKDLPECKNIRFAPKEIDDL